MESPTEKTASSNDSHKDDQNSKMTSKERREKYFTELRSWLRTVNSYECYYNKLQRESLEKYQKDLRPSEAPREVSNNVPETTTVGPSQFVGKL